MVMVYCLIPHRSSKKFIVFVFLSIFCQFFNVFVFMSAFRWFFYCVLITVRLPSIPHIILLLTSFLVPSLIVGYRPTEASLANEIWDELRPHFN